jgi:outer membrane immunogenic protein
MVGAVVHKFQHLLRGDLHTHGNGKSTSFATLRGRAGVATDRGLLYATAGGVWTSGSDQFVAAVGSTNTTISGGNGNKVGWTVGGGVEAAFYDNWSLKLEYLYIATKNLTGASALPFGLGTESANVRDNIIRLGINYRFGPTGLVAY